MAISTYPKRIVTLAIEDCGPMDSGGGSCPHCGAEGRWIHHFLCDDGQVHAAMSGCIKLYPKAQRTPLSIMADAAMGKLQEAKRGNKDIKLASWFVEVMDALDKLQSGQMTLEHVEDVAREAYQRRESWLRRNGYRGRRRR